MVRYANRSRTAKRVFGGLTPCATHHFPGGSLHAPYVLASRPSPSPFGSPPRGPNRPADEPPTTTREIFVPVADLKVLLESEPHRVLLSRQEYDDLLKKASTRTPEKHVPHPVVIVSSDYDITVEEGRAKLHGTIAIDVLDDGLHALPLDFGGVGLLAAKLDEKPAAIGFAADGRLNLLVSGQGRHQLALDMVAPLEMNSAQQYLGFRVTNAAVGRWRLTVPGDVEIKSGATSFPAPWMMRPSSPASNSCRPVLRVAAIARSRCR